MSRNINYVVTPIRTVNNTVVVHEHRAPTDESIKLYNELRQKAIDSIVYSTVIKNTLYEAQVMVTKNFTFSLDYEVHYIFKLNGEEFKGKVVIAYYDVRDKNQLPKLIYGKFIEILSEKLTRQAFEDPEVWRKL